MRAVHERPLPAAFQIEVVKRGVAEIDGESARLEAGEDRFAGALQGLKSDTSAVCGPLFDQTRGLGKMTFRHNSLSSKP